MDIVSSQALQSPPDLPAKLEGEYFYENKIRYLEFSQVKGFFCLAIKVPHSFTEADLPNTVQLKINEEEVRVSKEELSLKLGISQRQFSTVKQMKKTPNLLNQMVHRRLELVAFWISNLRQMKDLQFVFAPSEKEKFVQTICKIESEKTQWRPKSGHTSYIKKSERLHHSILYHANGSLFINTKTVVGKGAYSVVKLALNYFQQERWVKISPKNEIQTQQAVMKLLKAKLDETEKEKEKISGLSQILIAQYEKPNGDKRLKYYMPHFKCDLTLAKKNLLHEQKIQIIKDLAHGLRLLHLWGFAHCDIKSDNILLSKDSNHAVIADFGLSIHRSQNLVLGLRGTLDYLPPELCEKAITRENVTFDEFQRGDIWGLGCIIWLLLGDIDQLPWINSDEDISFGDEECKLVIKEIISSTPKIKHKDPKIEKLLHRIFELDPQKRATAEEVYQAVCAL